MLRSLFHRWQRWMVHRGSAEIIPRRKLDGPLERYLDRFVLLKLPFLSINLHCFRASDPDVPHDHPWHNISFPLTHSVIEYGADGTFRILKRFRPYYRHASEFHRLVVDSSPEFKGAWSLFIQFRWRRHWGFMSWDHGHWVPSAEFLKKHNLPPVPAHPKVRYGLFPQTTYPGHGHYYKDVLGQIERERIIDAAR